MSDRYVSKFNKDTSWIRNNDNEDTDSLVQDGKETSKTTSVKSLTKRFGSASDEPPFSGSTYPSSRNTSTSTRSTTTTRVTKDGTTESTVTTTKDLSSPTRFTERVKSSSQGSQYTTYSPTRTTKVTGTPIASNSDAENKLYDTLIPSSIKDPPSSATYSPSSSLTERTITTNKYVQDKPYDQDITSTIKDIFSPTHSIVSSSETVTVKSSPEKRTHYSTYSSARTTKVTERTISAGAEDVTDMPSSIKQAWTPTDRPVDDLYDTLLPKAITGASDPPSSDSIRRREIVTVESSRGGESPTSSSKWRSSSYSSYNDDAPTTRTSSYSISSTASDDYSREKSSSLSRKSIPYEYSSASSPTAYSSSSYKSSRSVLEKDLCTSCHTPFNGDAKMLLDDLSVKCHASCFKCEVCNSNLGNLKAGDSVWIYRHMVHCENCFEITREKWRR
ncbi:sciellin [Brachionichthys hirsutus]|uniref:sciellin n=1 Tax=Brachionichthys hirsutus TaxID=412623 RepID=UPI0036043FD5